MHDAVGVRERLDHLQPGATFDRAAIVGLELGRDLRWKKLIVGLAIELGPRPAEDSGGCVVGIDISTLQVFDPRQAGQVLRKAGELLLSLAKGLLSLLAADELTELSAGAADHRQDF